MAFIRCGDPRKEQCNNLKESLIFIFLLLAHAQTFDRCVILAMFISGLGLLTKNIILKLRRKDAQCTLGMRNSTGSPLFSDFKSDLSRAFPGSFVPDRWPKERRRWVRGWIRSHSEVSSL